MERFILTADRPAPHPVATMRVAPSPYPDTAIEPPTLAVLLVRGRARLSRFLAIRRDLHFIVNGRVAEARKERIALGLHFARTF